MSYDTELVRGMIYEDEPKVVAVKEENLQRGMRYLPEECAALAEEVCESISSDKNANVIKNIFAPLLFNFWQKVLHSMVSKHLPKQIYCVMSQDKKQWFPVLSRYKRNPLTLA